MGFTIRGLASAALVSCCFHLTSALVAQSQAPEPTLPSRIQHLEHIYERAEGPITETLTVAVAANNTCGYHTAYVTCASSSSCLYETKKFNVAFCGASGIRTTCIGRSDALNTDKCDEYCRRNTNIRKCTDTPLSECYTLYYPNNMTGHVCASTSGYINAALFSGFDDLSESILEVNVYPAAATASTTEASTTEALSTEGSGTEISDESTSTGATATNTDESQEEGGGGGKNNVGAIAGGVVGGVVGLAALGLAILFIRRRSNKKKQQQTPVEMADQNSLQPQVPYGMTPEQQQRWSTVSQSPPAWKPTDVAPNQSPQILVEAPNESAAQVHEMDAGERSGGK
ncbi:hypothetical protein FSHL1_005380 [Fusarium sambucinum]